MRLRRTDPAGPSGLPSPSGPAGPAGAGPAVAGDRAPTEPEEPRTLSTLPLPLTRTSLTAQIVLLVVAVALSVAAVAGVVGTALVRSTAQDVSRNYLAGQADVVAGQQADAASTRIALPKLAQVLRGENITLAVIDADGHITGPQQAVRAATAAGAAKLPTSGSVSRTVTVGGRRFLVEGRYDTAGASRGFALVTPADNGVGNGGSVQRRVLLALGIGLAVAVLGGLLLARLMARPLRRTAAVARAMGAGSRDLRARVAGPHEVADVALAVNELADALQHSESRQRDFLTSVSHELRTPLTAIAGQSQALSDGIVPAAEAPEVGAVIAAESARMQRLVADLLDLARLGADSFRVEEAPCDLTALTAQLRPVWEVRCRQRGARLVLEVPAGPVVVVTDARRLRQVLDGLAENALRLLGPDRPLVFAVTPGPAGAARLQVRDGGPGLRPEDYPVAFQRGLLHERYRATRPSGAGLGLALAQSLITRLGGTITAGPAPEGGVAMTIDLPAGAAAGAGNALAER